MAHRDILQRRLLILAGLFLFLFSLILTVAPVIHASSLGDTTLTDYRWGHWIIFVIWGAVFTIIHHQTCQYLPNRDPYLLPLAAMLSGWGGLTVYRLIPAFGLRQGLWLLVAATLLVFGLRLPHELGFLRRYKYMWLVSGLFLTSLTLFFGTNPLGYGPRLWLGCCGFYFQPSEPLKLFLIVYLAAYLADQPLSQILSRSALPLLPLLAPTLLLTALAIALLVAQRDLGTALIFIFLYICVVYMATGSKRLLASGIFSIVLASVLGYLLFDVVRLRLEAWVNPWLDPSGRSYQIVQSLLAVANGGLLGRGPGIGHPMVVPIVHSDFIFAAIAEEFGLVGVLGMVILLGLFLNRGLRVAFYAADVFRRYLAAGLTFYIVGQSSLIIGGNLRLLPLTGVTLPFVSYGGTSLVTAFLSLLLLLHISNLSEAEQDAHEVGGLFDPFTLWHRSLFQIATLLSLGLVALAVVAGWWSIYRGPSLLTRTDNPRRVIDDRNVRRGALLDALDRPLALTVGEAGSYRRQYLYPDLGPVLGYTHPVYGQSGLEANLDPILRGLEGYSTWVVWWNHLVYGRPPPGLDVCLSIDLDLQFVADALLQGRRGALVLLESDSGKVLVMASHPTFDANFLDQTWETLIKDKEAPLVNRALQGRYPLGAAAGPLLAAEIMNEDGALPLPPPTWTYWQDNHPLPCALPLDASVLSGQAEAQVAWRQAITRGCPAATVRLLERLDDLAGFLNQLGLDSVVASPSSADPVLAILGEGQVVWHISPLRMASAIAALNNSGIPATPHLTQAVKTPQGGWTTAQTQDKEVQVIASDAAAMAADMLAVENENVDFWQVVAIASYGDPGLTWYLGGSLPGRLATPLTLVLVLEEATPVPALEIGQAMLVRALARP